MSIIRSSVAAGAALALTLLLGACGDGAETDPAGLEGTWVLVQFQEGNSSDPLVDSTMTLKADRVSGNAGVNDLTGSYKASDDGKITFTKVDTKRKAGPQEAVDQETRLLKSLAKATAFEIDEADDDDEHSELELKNSYGQTVAVFLQAS